MAITEYEDQIQSIVNEPNHEGFVYDFLSVYEKIPKATITKLRKGLNNLSKEPGEVYLKNKLYFKQTDSDLMQAYVDVQARVNELGTKPRFIIVTDYKQLLAKDTKTHDSLDIEFSKLPQKFEFFLAWNGIEKADFDKENPADVRAAERFAKLYDVVVKDNPHASRKGLNLFLIRVLFCLFAEDTNIFENNLFTNRVKQMTKEDGSDLDHFINQLFSVLDIEKDNRPEDTPSWLADFPYVDGNLFKDPHESLKFTRHSRKLIIDAGEKLEWDQINPDILGSMIQAVASEDSRSHLGMHYTSVPNIMKVIKPLFLDDLRKSFEDAKGNEKKLNELYDRIGKIKFMDPACGSGNFLIITYKELRQLEIDILIELNNIGVSTMYVPSVTLNQFYGIEIDDFACDVTRLSLWIAEHQMNVKLHEQISDAVRPTLPLQHAGAILCGNALRINWNEFLPHQSNDEVYLFGNPPYEGAKKKSESQSSDLQLVFPKSAKYKKLDYVSGWLYESSKYIESTKAKASFVTTNSIFQGEQVPYLWDYVLNHAQIFFAHRSFNWKNNAKGNAGITVSIVGLAGMNYSGAKYLFDETTVHKCLAISPYLTDGKTVMVRPTTKNINEGMPPSFLGCVALDGGNLILSNDEMKRLVSEYPDVRTIIRKFISSKDFIQGTIRYTLWMNINSYSKFRHIANVEERVTRVKEFRLASGQSGRSVSGTPYSFFTKNARENSIQTYHSANNGEMMSILIPSPASSNRYYVPLGYVGEDTVVPSGATMIYDAPLWLLGLLSSNMHMVWLRTIGGRMRNDFRYSGSVVYNTFPITQLSDRRKNEIEDLVWKILDIRDEEGGTLADLYGSPLAAKNPKPMNPRLKAAHEELDQVVDRAYRDRPFKDDNERLALLLDMYSKKVNEEK